MHSKTNSRIPVIDSDTATRSSGPAQPMSRADPGDSAWQSTWKMCCGSREPQDTRSVNYVGQIIDIRTRQYFDHLKR